MQIPDGIEGTLLCWNANTANKHGHKKECKIKEFIYLLKKAISKYLYEEWPCMTLIQYIVLFPSSRSLAIVLSYNEQVNLKVSLNIFLDSPFPLVEITISLSCHSVICLHSRNVEQQTLQAHYKLMLYFVFSIHSGGDR